MRARAQSSKWPKDRSWRCASAFAIIGCGTEDYCSAFLDQHQFVTCTLLGEVKQFEIVHDAPASEGGADFDLQENWSSRTQKLAKVNAMSITGDRMAIGGLTGDGKGVDEIWDVSKDAVERVIASSASTVSKDDGSTQ